MSKLTGYALSRQWFDMVWETPELTANHTSLYLWLCEIWNRVGSPDKFQITSTECMKGMCCKTYKTYKKCLDDLIDMGCIKLLKQSKNQYQCNIIALVNFDKAPTKALSKAEVKARTKALPIFLNPKPLTLNHASVDAEERFPLFWNSYPKKKSKGDAINAWKKIKPTKELFEKIMASLETEKKSGQWAKEGGQYIPYPASWLNSMGWENESDVAEIAKKPHQFIEGERDALMTMDKEEFKIWRANQERKIGSA